MGPRRHGADGGAQAEGRPGEGAALPGGSALSSNGWNTANQRRWREGSRLTGPRGSKAQLASGNRKPQGHQAGCCCLLATGWETVLGLEGHP